MERNRYARESCMNIVKTVIDWIKSLPKAEPAVGIGVVISGLTTAQAALQGTVSWHDALPVLIGLVIRQVVWSPATVEAVAEAEKHSAPE